jgi:hypothetical protein
LSGKHAVTMILPHTVWNRLAEISQSSGVPRNGIASLAIEYWLRRFYASDEAAQRITDRNTIYDAHGNTRSLAAIESSHEH